MKFQQIRSATSIVTFANRRFLIDPMLSAQGTYRLSQTPPALVAAIRIAICLARFKICLTLMPSL